MLFPLESRCLQITTDVSEITQNVRRDLIFIFTEYSENTSTFCVDIFSGRDKRKCF